jgi:predicted Rossmann fold flavoprotein
VQEAKQRMAVFHYGRRVHRIERRADGFDVCGANETFEARRIVLATGGLSYPQTGSSGDGYQFAQALGHEVAKPRPSLVPLITAEPWPGELAGVSLAQVQLKARLQERQETTSGGLVFTRFGIGGPAVLELSRFLTDLLPSRRHPIPVWVDLVPNLPHDQLAQRMVSQCAEYPKKSVAALVGTLVPRRLARIICVLCTCEDLPAGHLPKPKRRQIVQTLKSLKQSISATRPMAEATVTRGGICVDQINPQTMESTLCPGLYFAGEVMDLDGPCGGYHLQMCWSTGALAGRSAGGRRDAHRRLFSC